MVARQAHNLKAGSSILSPATNLTFRRSPQTRFGVFYCIKPPTTVCFIAHQMRRICRAIASRFAPGTSASPRLSPATKKNTPKSCLHRPSNAVHLRGDCQSLTLPALRLRLVYPPLPKKIRRPQVGFIFLTKPHLSRHSPYGRRRKASLHAFAAIAKALHSKAIGFSSHLHQTPFRLAGSPSSIIPLLVPP